MHIILQISVSRRKWLHYVYYILLFTESKSGVHREMPSGRVQKYYPLDVQEGLAELGRSKKRDQPRIVM